MEVFKQVQSSTFSNTKWYLVTNPTHFFNNFTRRDEQLKTGMMLSSVYISEKDINNLMASLLYTNTCKYPMFEPLIRSEEHKPVVQNYENITEINEQTVRRVMKNPYREVPMSGPHIRSYNQLREYAKDIINIANSYIKANEAKNEAKKSVAVSIPDEKVYEQKLAKMSLLSDSVVSTKWYICHTSFLTNDGRIYPGMIYSKDVCSERNKVEDHGIFINKGRKPLIDILKIDSTKTDKYINIDKFNYERVLKGFDGLILSNPVSYDSHGQFSKEYIIEHLKICVQIGLNAIINLNFKKNKIPEPTVDKPSYDHLHPVSENNSTRWISKNKPSSRYPTTKNKTPLSFSKPKLKAIKSLMRKPITV